MWSVIVFNELMCAEPDPVSGGTRLAKHTTLCQPRSGPLMFQIGLLVGNV